MDERLTPIANRSIIIVGDERMDVLPNVDKVVIPIEKFTEYALNWDKDPDKAMAFQLALGYNLRNVEILIADIRANADKFPTRIKGENAYGTLYEVIMVLTGANGKTARVLTGWIDDTAKGEIRLTTVHVD